MSKLTIDGYGDNLNINGNFMESELMAYLAARSIKNLPITFPMTTGVYKPMSCGKITLPKINLF